MDFVKLILNTDNSENVCFLCFKHDDNAMDLYKHIFVQDENEAVTVTLFSMIKFLFPSHDILLRQSCEFCTQLIMCMYLTIRRHNVKRKMLSIVSDNILEVLDDKSLHHIEDIDNPFKILINCTKMSSESIKKSYVEEKDIENFNEWIHNCKKCNMKFRSKELLKKHIKISHQNLNKAILCDVCGKVFRTPKTLKAHLNCHSEESCPYCFKVLKTHSHYKLHLKSHKVKVKRKRYTEYNCNHCSYKTKDKGSLEAHINKIHLGKRPYVCTICLKGFYKKKTLTEHVLTHKEVKTVTCEICGDSFIHKKTLLEHLRLHTGEKPYECDICGARFVTSGRKTDHIKRKHMEKSECCLICNRKYSLKKELRRHMETMHAETKVDKF